MLKFAENVRTTVVRNQQLQQFQKIAKFSNVILTLQGEIQRAVQVIISLYIFKMISLLKILLTLLCSAIVIIGVLVFQYPVMTALNDKAEVSAEKETRNIGQIDWW